ncbi:MAG TPA: beta-galactosidase [Bacteroides sp.]|nr:beta-galactosidase [Bacteroides sp.]
MKYLYFISLIAIISCNPDNQQHRACLDLAGEWQFSLDTLREGEKQQWYLDDLGDSVKLPGTTDLNGKGFLNEDTTTLHLNRIYTYEGIAWYRREVVIPDHFAGKHLRLFLERTKSSKIWIDSIFVGGSQLLQSPQIFDVPDYLAPGRHHITIQVNNSLELTPYGNVHIYSDHTQTNWNGIIGEIYIEASAKTFISGLRVYPDVAQRKIRAELSVDNRLGLENVDVELRVEKTENGKTTRLKPLQISTPCTEKIHLEYDLGEKCSVWDEFEQPLYQLTAIISRGDLKDSRTVPFGMRDFAVNGKKFSINGRTLFLRGKNDAAVFPVTGFTPTNTGDWLRIFRIAKSYGINHYRFHSYCPPEAAFTAADMAGIYLQAELPFWGGLGADSIAGMLRNEGYGMLDAYANHPSFVMFSHGNEIWGGHDRVEANIRALRAHDGRPLYTEGTNNNIGYTAPGAGSDFFVGARTPYAHDTVLTHTRLTHAFADSDGGGLLNTRTPSTTINFDEAVSRVDIPVIGHETGQYQIFPDYSEISKYTGVLRARNLEVFQDRLKEAGMAGMDGKFQQASGAWSAICYKAEMEAAMRTEDMAGFQLLDLQDFPGQGTALVGILDAFMDSKQVISPEGWRQSCNDVVLLPEFRKYCWTADETFRATIKVANYSNADITGDLIWRIASEEGKVLDEGTLTGLDIPCGGLATAGEMEADLAPVDRAEKFTFTCAVPGTPYLNTHDIWVYPADNDVKPASEMIVTGKLDGGVIQHLQQGGKVLYFPQTGDVSGNSYPGLFPPDFWNYGMFRGISERNGRPVSPGTLGLLMDPDHPLFNDFPTDFHTGWQWFSIIRHSNSLILDRISSGYDPIVRVIDNPERNHQLGLIFEFKTGSGKLLVCMSQLDQLADRPEARQLYQSILNYMDSEDFDPDYRITADELAGLFSVTR